MPVLTEWRCEVWAFVLGLLGGLERSGLAGNGDRAGVQTNNHPGGGPGIYLSIFIIVRSLVPTMPSLHILVWLADLGLAH